MSQVVEFVPVLGTIRAQIFGAAVGYNATLVNTLAFQVGHTPTQDEVDGVADLVKAWVINTYAAQVSPRIRFNRIEAWSLEEQEGPKSVMPLDVTGGAVTGVSPLADDFALAPLIILHGAGRGRWRTGRFYAFMPVQEEVRPNQFTEEHMVGLVAALTTLRDSANALALPLAVASESHQQSTLVGGITHSERLTMQKRRRPDFGR